MTGNDTEVQPQRRSWTGRQVVLGMFVFGVAMVAGLWLYWELYTRPYRVLQAAIAAEFPGSSPRAIGGKEKSHRADSPATLRLIVRVDFDPNAERARAERIAQRLAGLAKANHDVTQYALLDIHLEQRVPEQETRHWSVAKPVAEWGESGELRDES